MRCWPQPRLGALTCRTGRWQGPTGDSSRHACVRGWGGGPARRRWRTLRGTQEAQSLSTCMQELCCGCGRRTSRLDTLDLRQSMRQAAAAAAVCVCSARGAGPAQHAGAPQLSRAPLSQHLQLLRRDRPLLHVYPRSGSLVKQLRDPPLVLLKLRHVEPLVGVRGVYAQRDGEEADVQPKAPQEMGEVHGPDAAWARQGP